MTDTPTQAPVTDELVDAAARELYGHARGQGVSLPMGWSVAPAAVRNPYIMAAQRVVARISADIRADERERLAKLVDGATAADTTWPVVAAWLRAHARSQGGEDG